MTRRRWSLLAALFAAALALPHAPLDAQKGQDAKKKTAPKPVNLVWPLPPEQPRVRYLRAYRGEIDFDKKKESKFKALLLGPDSPKPMAVLVKPYGVAVSTNGRQVYVGIRQVTTFNPIPPPPCIAPPPPGGPPCPTYPMEIVNYRVLVLDAASNTFVAKVELDGTPFGVAVDPQGHAVYVTTPATGTLWVLDGRTATVVRKLAVGVAPYGVSVHPDGSRVYVADAYSGSVRVLDVATGQLVAEVGVGASPIAFGAFVGPPADLLAVEYYHGTYGHYFVTAGADEITRLDSGAIAGWARTGESFRVRPLRTPGAADVCRFWSGSTFTPKSSHFYTPFDWERATVRGNPAWTYDGTRFAANLPDATGACAPGRIPLYRLYNNGMTGAPNHRFTTSAGIRSATVAQGWTPEGSGALGVSACVQAP